MIRLTYSLLILLGVTILVSSCEKEDLDARGEVPQEVITQLRNLGFNPDGIEKVDEGYRIERDIIITEEFLNSEIHEHRVPNAEQYSTNNLVSTGGSRTITIYMSAPQPSSGASTVSGGSSSTTPGGGGGGVGGPADAPAGGNPGPPGGGGGGGGGNDGGSFQFDQAYADALADAIGRYNSENLEITFSRTSDQASADIVFTRLSKRDERRGILGSAGFPTSGGDPYNEIRMSGVIQSSYGWSTAAIATVIAHEMGHCIGFRHTDYFDRSISCGSGGDEGASTVGANHIPGTPTGASLADQSFMLSCTGGGDRPFNADDKVALDFLY